MSEESAVSNLPPEASLPSFERPPVNETALSIQFAPIPGLIPFLGLYWAQNRSIFPKAQVLSPLANVTERLDQPFSSPKVGIQFVAEPSLRYWLLPTNENELIQIQSDRFVYNWRRVTGSETYPRYPAVRIALEREWNRFCFFLRTEKLAAPELNQCEVTYVNHIEYGEGWSDYGQLNRVIKPWSGAHSGAFLPNPERVNLEAHYRLSDHQGRLHISVEPVVRGRDSKEVLQVTVTARGASASSSVDDMLAWMDTARCWVVNGFCDFTTDSMQQVWGREE